jgi:glutathione S-transferase
VLLDEGAVFCDSFDIARHAEAYARSSPLWPPGRAAEVEAWNDASELALRAGRALLFHRLVDDPAAQLDQVPRFVPAPFRPLLRPLVRLGIGYLRRKHGADEAFTSAAHTRLDDALAALRNALAGGSYLLHQFSYADIAMAVVCQFVRPVDDRYIRLAAANRACWTEPSLATKYQDLIEWRDALYARHRRLRRSPS